MKYLSNCTGSRASLFLFIIPLIIFCSCKKIDADSFYYSGNIKVELIIPGDTLAILLKDTVLNPADTSVNYLVKLRNFANSAMAQQNFDSAGYLSDKGFVSDKIKLILSQRNYKKRSKLETEAISLKIPANKSFIENTGYLARIKRTGKPVIITNELIIQFKDGTTQNKINNLLEECKLEIKRKNPYVNLQYTVSTTKRSPYDALKISHKLIERSIVQFAQPNIIYIKKTQSPDMADPYFPNQWSLHNTMENCVEDADADVDLAWNITEGKDNTIIADIDVGFDVEQEDLKNKFAVNLLDLPWDRIDNDVNGYIDDTIGWNFISQSNNLEGSPHGTAVAGIIGAEGNNGLGIKGACPQCRILPVRTDHSFDTDRDALSFGYAQSRGAKVINCSWEYDGMPVPDNVALAIKKAFEAGIAVICSATNSHEDYCAGFLDLSSLDSAIGVSRSTCQDKYDLSGYGKCLDLLAPTAAETPGYGDLKIYTTDISGLGGYNNGKVDLNCPDADALLNPDYTACFRGTSASAALTSGVAGLIVSVDPSITPRQIQYLLQDCADKIENSVGKYDSNDGKSTTGTHGYGRINAYEAVKIASPDIDKGGRNGVDIFLRDNELDWGNTEKPSTYSFEPVRGGFIPCWESMDIKVDAPDASSNFSPPTSSKEFDDFVDENPIGGKINKVYVRVRNRGFKDARDITVKLHWVHAGAALPPLPSDFWDKFPDDATEISAWNFLKPKLISTLEYSGASTVILGENAAQIVSFDFNAPVHDPSTRNHYCLMAIISSPDDLIPKDELKMNPNGYTMDYVTSHYNNVTHRNYNIETAESSFRTEFFMYNPLAEATYSKLEISFKGQEIPVILSDSLKGKLIYLAKNEKKLVRCNIDPTALTKPTEIIIEQKIPGKKKGEFIIVGGLNYFIMPSSKNKK